MTEKTATRRHAVPSGPTSPARIVLPPARLAIRRILGSPRQETKGTGGEILGSFASRFSALHGRGRPLPASERSFFEPRFGRDLAAVRIHEGPAAAEAARSVGARAFTLGDSIVFGRGEYGPGTREGRRLLAHELAHVTQQRTPGAAPRLQRLVDPDCDTKTRLPMSGTATVPASAPSAGVVGEAFSPTFTGAKGTVVTITASASYVTSPPSWVLGRENFSVTLRQCGFWDSDVSAMVTGIIGRGSITFTRTLPGPGWLVGRDDYYLRLGNASSSAAVEVTFRVT